MALTEDELSVESSSVPPNESRGLGVNGLSGPYTRSFFQCLTCCNCIFLLGLSGLLFLEARKVSSLEDSVTKDQALIQALQQQVRAKEEFQGEIQELESQVQSEHNLTLLTLAGIFTLLTCLISMFHISSHLQKMNQPDIQRKIIAILWMSPIYSVTSFLSLLYPPLEGYMAIVKDFYESYCIYTFLSFLILVLGRGSRENAVEVLAMHAHHLERPAKCLSRWYEAPPESSDTAKANAVITECQILAMQFVFIRPLTTVMYVIYRSVNESRQIADDTLASSPSSSSMGKYINDTGTRLLRWMQEEGQNSTSTIIAPSGFPTISPVMFDSTEFSTLVPTAFIDSGATEDFTEATKAYFKSFGFFLAMIVNVSVFFAFTGLLKFYHSVHNDLAWCRPWPKFLTIKGVVFLTFWQGLAILIVVNLDGTNKNDEDPTARGHRYQNTLICCEMLLFSLTHWCVFPAEEWAVGYEPPQKVNQPGIGLQDFVSDVEQIYQNGRRRRKIRRRRGHRSSRFDSEAPYHRPGRHEAVQGAADPFDDENTFPSDISPDRNTTSATLPVVSVDEVHQRPRFLSDGSSVKADDEDEDDDLELL